MTLSFQDPSRRSSPYRFSFPATPPRFPRAIAYTIAFVLLLSLFFFLGCNSTIHTHGGWLRKQSSHACTLCPTPCPPLPPAAPEPAEASWPLTPAVPAQDPDLPLLNPFPNDPFPSLPSTMPDLDFSQPPLPVPETTSLDFHPTTLPLLVIQFP